MNDTEKIEEYWHGESEKFARLYGPANWLSPNTFVSRFLNIRTDMCLRLATVGSSDSVLDLGCGSGVHMQLLCSRCANITGIDYSAVMVGAARRDLTAIGARNRGLAVANAHKLPFKDKSFDWIISMGLLDYVSSPQRVLRECYRVLKDSGRIVFTIPKSPSSFSFLRSPIGNIVRAKVFNLPPVGNVSSFMDLNALLRSAALRLHCARSIWTAMWVVKAAKGNP